MRVQTQLNKVKPPADVSDSKRNLSSELDKNPDANSTSEFDRIAQQNKKVKQFGTDICRSCGNNPHAPCCN